MLFKRLRSRIVSHTLASNVETVLPDYSVAYGRVVGYTNRNREQSLVIRGNDDSLNSPQSDNHQAKRKPKRSKVQIISSSNVLSFPKSLDSSPINAGASFSESEPASPMFSYYVGDLHKAVTEEILLSFFSQFSSVDSVRVCVDTFTSLSKGYGYVNFTNQIEAEAAIKLLNYTCLMGQEIRIMPAIHDKNKREATGCNLFISNLPSSFTSRKLFEYFSHHGDILTCKFDEKKRHGFVSYSDPQVAQRVIGRCNGVEIEGHQVYVGTHVQKAKRISTTRTHFSKERGDEPKVFVKNLPLDVSETTLRRVFGSFGDIRTIHFHPVPKFNACWALVVYSEATSAEGALRGLQDYELEGRVLSVSKAFHKTKGSVSHENGNDAQIPYGENAIFVTELPPQISDSSLKAVAAQYVPIKQLVLFRQHGRTKGYAVLETYNQSDAATLLAMLQVTEIYGSRLRASRHTPSLVSQSSSPDSATKVPGCNQAVYDGLISLSGVDSPNLGHRAIYYLVPFSHATVQRTSVEPLSPISCDSVSVP